MNFASQLERCMQQMAQSGKSKLHCCDRRVHPLNYSSNNCQIWCSRRFKIFQKFSFDSWPLNALLKWIRMYQQNLPTLFRGAHPRSYTEEGDAGFTD